MAKIRLVPQTREFYTLFDRAAQNLVTTAQLLLDLLEHCPDRRDLVDRIKDCEHEGDSVTHDIVQLVNKTFVTPIDGEDIYDLATRSTTCATSWTRSPTSSTCTGSTRCRPRRSSRRW